uniref:Uncharacterized protein n=1 Tax=viral metagenome TaxID=1070528 RepID=A0A6M3KHC0_9ZZZZ
MKNFFICLSIFTLGFSLSWVIKPPIIKKIKEETILYSLPKGVTTQDFCSSFYGEEHKKLEDNYKKIYDRKIADIEEYVNGYRDGYKNAK